MIDKTYIIYESFDAKKLLESKIPENSIILPITPNAFSILKESKLILVPPKKKFLFNSGIIPLSSGKKYCIIDP